VLNFTPVSSCVLFDGRPCMAVRVKAWLHVQFIACNALQLLHAIIAGFQTCSENIREAKVLQPMTAFGGIT